MNRVIKSFDKFATSELHEGGFRGRVIIGRGKHKNEFVDPYGNKNFITEFDEVISDEENIIPIGGYQFAFDKLFNIALDDETTLRVGDLNDEAPQMRIGVSRGQYKSKYYDAEKSINNTALSLNGGINISAMNFIFGFMIGDGGCREDNLTVIAPNYKDRGLFHAIPFRMSTDGTDIPNGKYFGKASTSESSLGAIIDSYYVKTFDTPDPHIVHCWATDSNSEISPVDDTVFSSTSSMPIESFVEMNLSITADDCRGYFTTNDTTPRINELGLVSGWYNGEEGDYESLRLFSHFCRPTITLADGDSIDIIYRLYAR